MSQALIDAPVTTCPAHSGTVTFDQLEHHHD